MATNSTQDVCDHRTLEVCLLLSTSMVVGLVSGLVLALLGIAPGVAVAGGAGALVGAFGLGMSALTYIKRQGN
ncbi:hypothetical protein H8N00_23005 [Streptomyces sp. AC563]|uniref:hypothetical protein n=1 Tax=Streptomyces buecherae TaxID=2763006 RepID=UPI00164D7758|nr:hypothetical protein [Streptomyces buecherae]MBC3991697.1 hypothetical protein [Streptomyces buecherae]